MKNKKNIILICIIGVLIVLGIIVAIIISKKNHKTVETFNNNITTNENIENTNVENTNTENALNENKNNIVEKNVTTSNNTKKDENNSEEANIDEIERQKTNEEKAIEIAKNDWGEDSSVDFVNENKRNDGKYQVAVRKKDTRNAVGYYYIDVTNKSFEKEIEY